MLTVGVAQGKRRWADMQESQVVAQVGAKVQLRHPALKVGSKKLRLRLPTSVPRSMAHCLFPQPTEAAQQQNRP